MGRVTGAILTNQAYSRGRTAPMLDLQHGGQMGYAPNLSEWVSNQAYIRRNLFCLLLEAPKFFQYLPDSDKWVSTLRAILELHPKTIEGLNGGLTVETAETPVGGGGEMQEEFTDVKKARSQPQFSYDEKYGMPIQTFLREWIINGMMDPDSKVANIGTLAGARPEDMLADQYACSCIFIEPDPTHRKVVKSWLSTNMFPKATGDMIGKRDITAGLELTTINIEFTAITQFNLGSNVLAQRLLDGINITNANPYLRPAFINGVEPNVDAGSAANTGYRNSAETLGATALNRG